MIKPNESSHAALFAAISGMCAVFIGLGLARFAYSPLVPAMVSAGWFSTVEAGHLIAINLIGYFIGALFIKFFAKNFSPLLLTKIALVICVFGLFGRSFDLGIPWFSMWRFLVGFFGAVLMITTPSFVLTAVPIEERNKTSGIIFTGLGFGIFVAGLLVAGFAKGSVHDIWLIFGIISFIAAAICWLCLPKHANFHQPHHEVLHVEAKKPLSLSIKYLFIAYTFIAMAFVPHLLFLVDYLTSNRGYSHSQASLVYAGLGVGAMLGALICSGLARLLGIYCALLLVMASCIVATLIIFCNGYFYIIASAFFIGLFFTGMVMLISTRLLELDEAKNHANLWGGMTIGFAIGQVISSYFVIYIDHVYNQQGASFMFAAVTFFLSFIFVALAKDPEQDE